MTDDQAASASLSIYRVLFERGPHPVLIADRASLRVVKANAAAATRFGYALAELLDLPLRKLWPAAETVLLQRRGPAHAAASQQTFVHKRGDPIETTLALQEMLVAGAPALALHLSETSGDRFAAALLEAQSRVLEMVARGTSLAVVLEALVREMERLADGMIASVLLADEDGRHARHGAAPSLPQDYWKAVDGLPIAPSSGACGTAMYLNRTVVAQDIATDPLWRDYRALALQHELRACWSTPIRSSTGSVLGAFAIYYREPREPRARDQRLVDLAAHIAAVAVERHNADGVLLRAEARLWAIVDHASAAISLKDVEGRYLLVNRRFEELTGIPAALAQGRTDRQLFPQRVASAYSANDREVLDTRKGIAFEEEFEQADGVRVHLAVKFPLLHPGGACYGIGAILCDISERKRAEQALARSREEMRALAARLERVREDERARIAREIHDELGQVLASLHLNHSLLARSVREDPAPERERIAAELESLQQTVAGALQSVRRIAMELRPDALDRRGLVGAVEWQVTEFARRTGVRCHLRLPERALQADAERSAALFRILQEALANVARHSGATEVQVELLQQASSLEMRIADNGRGIPQGEGRHGPSLGLLNMRERAAALGGTTSVASAPGAGTTITVRMPVG